jgi:predicted nucleotidyltransferase
MTDKDMSGENHDQVSDINDPRLIEQVVQTIVEAVHPIRIILFGSAARGDGGPNSDLDLLIVMPNGIHRRQIARHVYRELCGMGFAKDVIVVTEEDIRRFKDNPSLIIMPALQEGKELYRAAG